MTRRGDRSPRLAPSGQTSRGVPEDGHGQAVGVGRPGTGEERDAVGSAMDCSLPGGRRRPGAEDVILGRRMGLFQRALEKHKGQEFLRRPTDGNGLAVGIVRPVTGKERDAVGSAKDCSLPGGRQLPDTGDVSPGRRRLEKTKNACTASAPTNSINSPTVVKDPNRAQRSSSLGPHRPPSLLKNQPESSTSTTDPKKTSVPSGSRPSSSSQRREGRTKSYSTVRQPSIALANTPKKVQLATKSQPPAQRTPSSDKRRRRDERTNCPPIPRTASGTQTVRTSPEVKEQESSDVRSLL